MTLTETWYSTMILKNIYLKTLNNIYHMTRDQRNKVKRPEETSYGAKEGGNRKGRYSKKDKARDKHERMRNW